MKVRKEWLVEENDYRGTSIFCSYPIMRTFAASSLFHKKTTCLLLEYKDSHGEVWLYGHKIPDHIGNKFITPYGFGGIYVDGDPIKSYFRRELKKFCMEEDIKEIFIRHDLNPELHEVEFFHNDTLEHDKMFVKTKPFNEDVKKQRYYMKKAEEQGFWLKDTEKCSDDKERNHLIKDYHEIMMDTFMLQEASKKYFYSYKFVQDLIEADPVDIIVSVCYTHENEPASGALLFKEPFRAPKITHYLFAGTNQRGRDLGVTTFMLKELTEKFGLLNLGGGHQDSVRDFKEWNSDTKLDFHTTSLSVERKL